MKIVAVLSAILLTGILVSACREIPPASPEGSGSTAQETAAPADRGAESTAEQETASAEPRAEDILNATPATGVYLARYDGVSQKRKISTDGRYTLQTIVETTRWNAGQANIRPDAVLMVEGNCYFYRSDSGVLNDPIRNRTSVLSEEDRTWCNRLFDRFLIDLGYPDELTQLSGEPLAALRAFLVENGIPRRLENGVCYSTCIEDRNLTVGLNAETGQLDIRIGNNFSLMWDDENKLHLYFCSSQKATVTSVTGYGGKIFERDSTVSIKGSDNRDTPTILRYYVLLNLRSIDQEFREVFRINLSLRDLGYDYQDPRTVNLY